MTKNNKEFYKAWRLSFKYLLIVILACAGFRTFILVMSGGGESITFSSIVLGLLIAIFGTGLLTMFIAWYGTRGK
ncbi:MAG TPA: hypothetical protein DF774_07415 [Rheinheimera sp.]|uniref:hypothetical protein n=1 Tax=Rheinheimera sp. TaxID=1869214 RepID=UPI000EC4565C|nr:hypothetical protein [Rheinheimera sp.]HCU65568.1 hypothetical protein [Rheinheimera sp.]